MREFLTVKGASRLFERHPGTIRQWIKDKKILAKKLTGKDGIYHICNDDILELMIKKIGNKKRKEVNNK